MAPSTQIDELASAIVARFLRANAYTETLQAFIREAGLAPDAGQASGDDTHNLTIQSLLEEKKAYDHSVSFERLGNESREIFSWRIPGKVIVTSSDACGDVQSSPDRRALLMNRHLPSAYKLMLTRA